MFLEPVVADLLDVRLRHHPAGPGGGGAIEGHKVRPRLLEPEAYAPRIDHLDLADALFEELCAGALVPLERELHIPRGHRIVVVSLYALVFTELRNEFGRG